MAIAGGKRGTSGHPAMREQAMYQPPSHGPPRVSGAPPHCPSCQKPLTAEYVCWGCCDRLCRCCGQLTGSAFIDICWPCWFRSAARGESTRPPCAKAEAAHEST
jgi:hypothetical protein